VIRLANCAAVTDVWQPAVLAVLNRVDNGRFGFRDGQPPARAVAGARTTRLSDGPYYIAGSPKRQDVREDRQGVELRLSLQIVDLVGGLPVEGAFVEIWHCDAFGRYSGYLDNDPDQLPNIPRMVLGRYAPSDSGLSLRGYELTDPDGRVEFVTIYPGAYTPRTRHIHVKVRRPGMRVLTTELYFPPEIDAVVLAQPPYNRRGARFTNQNDLEIYRSKGASGCWPRMMRDGSGYLAELALRVERAAVRPQSSSRTHN
jgi:protocatechuate 3,4-dioxygenase beta subunit